MNTINIKDGIVEVVSPKELKAYRKQLGYTQKRLAAEINVHTPMVSMWETGTRTINKHGLDRLKSLLASKGIKFKPDPEYKTIPEWEAETGRILNSSAPVFVGIMLPEAGKYRWRITTRKNAENDMKLVSEEMKKYHKIVVADPRNDPSLPQGENSGGCIKGSV